MRIVGQMEWDSFCLAVLDKNFPDTPKGSDISKVASERIIETCGQIDLIMGSPPCQDISIANRNAKGLDGARTGLWWQMYRLIQDIQPRWVVIENVPALSHRGGDRITAALEAENYWVYPMVFGAWAVGAPHKRDRVWIIGFLPEFQRKLANSARAMQRDGDVVYSPREGRQRQNGDDAGTSIFDPLGTSKEALRQLADSKRQGRKGSSRKELPGEESFSRSRELADTKGGLRRASSDLGRRTSARRCDEMDNPSKQGSQNDDQPSGTTQENAGSTQPSLLERIEKLEYASIKRLARRWLQKKKKSRIADTSRTQWPAPPGPYQHEWEYSRLIDSETEVALEMGESITRSPRLVARLRRERLKALGNANPSQTAEMVASAIIFVDKILRRLGI